MSGRPVAWILVHDLGRSGVPVAMERMARWAATARPGTVDVHVVAAHDGPLRAELAPSTASVTALEPAQGRSLPTQVQLGATEVLGRPVGRGLHHRWVRHRLRQLPTPDVVLVQGAGAWPTFTVVEPLVGRARVVLHLHELAVALSRSGLGPDLARVVQRPDLVLTVADAASSPAVAIGADPERVRVLPGAVDPPPLGWDHPLTTAPAPALVSIGPAGWRKADDRAVAAAHELHRRRGDAAWHWIGEPAPSAWAFAVGWADPLVRHPVAADPWAVAPDPAALVITSREDPLPLVALEAGARGVPVVATRTGGLPDLLADGRGLVADGHDLGALVDAVEGTLDDPASGRRRAVALREHVQAHHGVDVVGPAWLDALVGPG